MEWQSIDEQSIQQKWLFDLVIRSTGDVKRTGDEMAVVGGLLESLCGVLAGWVPMAGCSPLRLVGSKGGEVREGEVHYGLLFAMRMVVTG
ncbi:MAG: hypothetical protein G8345_04340 [Magnetococcales bacterium]|nr:hypothetical protein [Magnetococcales bacterium]NGZ26100.1 hypothetical protein [Magnetococcales bacterium]